tara:strand:- start:1183 stop:1398 length:216 start_codon:yes stop_codon:yes gene_type:complete
MYIDIGEYAMMEFIESPKTWFKATNSIEPVDIFKDDYSENTWFVCIPNLSNAFETFEECKEWAEGSVGIKS